MPHMLSARAIVSIGLRFLDIKLQVAKHFVSLPLYHHVVKMRC